MRPAPVARAQDVIQLTFPPGPRRLFALSTLLALVIVAAGCSDDDAASRVGEPEEPGATVTACTRASCGGLGVVRLRRLPEAATSAEVCVDARCQVVRQPVPDEVQVPLPPEDRTGGQDVRASNATAEVRGEGDEVLARGSTPIRLSALRPNGGQCAPTCWSGHATIKLGAP